MYEQQSHKHAANTQNDVIKWVRGSDRCDYSLPDRHNSLEGPRGSPLQVLHISAVSHHLKHSHASPASHWGHQYLITIGLHQYQLFISLTKKKKQRKSIISVLLDLRDHGVYPDTAKHLKEQRWSLQTGQNGLTFINHTNIHHQPQNIFMVPTTQHIHNLSSVNT